MSWALFCGYWWKHLKEPLSSSSIPWQTCSAYGHFSWDYCVYFEITHNYYCLMTICTYHMFYVLFTCSEKNAGCNSSQSEDKNRGNKFSNTQCITSLTPTRVTCIWIEKISCSNNVPVKFLVVAEDLIKLCIFWWCELIYLVALPYRTLFWLSQ